MPIRPENRAKYPPDWKAISAHRRFFVAGNRCEFCGVQNYAIGWRDGDGTFVYAPDWLFSQKHKAGYYQTSDRLKIILTVAHLNHDETDCSDENLRALCQKCHNSYDAANRRKGIKKRASISQMELTY